MTTTHQDNVEIYEAIYDVVRCIPAGRVTTYGAIAKAIGLKSGARMVGRAMSHAIMGDSPIPAQHVVNSVGELSGDKGYRKKKLEDEGIRVVHNRIVDFKKVFWDPKGEIQL